MRFVCPWEIIDGFRSPVEFRGFERWMTGQVSAGMARQVEVATPYAVDGLGEGVVPVEVWYVHVQSRETWRLVWPEPPFAGLFARVI